MAEKFMFVNPVDDMPMNFETLEQAVSTAKNYIGREDAFGETITAVNVFKIELVERVTETGG